jgi:hypothetical protein
MSNNIDLNILKRFIRDKVDVRMDKREAQELGVQKEFAEAIDDVDTNELEIDEILVDDDLVAKFAVMQQTEENKKQEAKDKETEKEEQRKVQDKNDTGM